MDDVPRHIGETAVDAMVADGERPVIDPGQGHYRSVKIVARIPGVRRRKRMISFCTSFPVAAGPAEFQGQLPGLILEMDVKDGTQTFKAISISEKADLAVIKEPTGKKHYTPEEFKKERDKMMKEMEQNNQGGNRQIRIN